MHLYHSSNKMYALIGFLVFIALAIPISGATEYECDSCSDCTNKWNLGSNNIIRINQSFTTDTWTCIHFNGHIHNVTLDCQNHKITVRNNEKAIYYNGYNNSYTTIKNCIIDAPDDNGNGGIEFQASSYITIENVTISGMRKTTASKAFGITSDPIDHNTVINSTIYDNSRGILFYDTVSKLYGNSVYNSNISYNDKGIELRHNNDGIFQNNTLIGNDYAFRIDAPQTDADNNTIKDNIITNSDISGIYSEGKDNIIYNNDFRNSVNVQISGTPNNNWNTTKQLENNIIGGNYIGGNFWGSLNSSGFSETCFDTEKDGICDSEYNITTNNIDYLPLTKDFTPPTITVFSPLNQTYGSVPIDFDVSADETINTWDYMLNSSANVSFTPNITLNVPLGTHSIEVYASDNAGNLGYSGKSWFTYADITPPSITIISPEYEIQYEQLNVSLSVTDDITGVKNCSFSVDGGANQSYNFTGENVIDNLSVGIYDLDVYCFDNSDNLAYTQTSFGIGQFIEVCDPDLISLCEPYDQWTNAYCLDENTLRKEKICTIEWLENETMKYCNWQKHEDISCQNGCYDNLTSLGSDCAPTELEILLITGVILLIFVVLISFLLGGKKKRRW